VARASTVCDPRRMRFGVLRFRIVLFLCLGAACARAQRTYVPIEGQALGGTAFSQGAGNGDFSSDIRLTLSDPPSRVRGGTTWRATFAASSARRLVAAQLQFAADGDNITRFIALSPDAETEIWTFDRIDVDGARFRFIAVDEQGNIGAVLSEPLSIDSTPPLVPDFSIDAPAITNQTRLAIVVNGPCADAAALLVGDADRTLPQNEPETRWQACTGAPYVELPPVDGVYEVFVWARDEVGNVSTSSKSATITLDQTPPEPPTVVVTSANPTSSFAAQLGVVDCTDRPFVLVEETDGTARPNATSAQWQLCSPSLATFSLQPSEGVHTLFVWAKDALDNVSLTGSSISIVVDTIPPIVDTTELADGASTTGTALAQVTIEASDASSTLAFRVVETSSAGDCIYADTGFSSQGTKTRSINLLLSAFDGVKKVCVWARDPAGNTSSVTPIAGTAGVNTDTIDFFSGSPPVVTLFEAVNPSAPATPRSFAPGDNVEVSLTVIDGQGLRAGAVSIEVRYNGAGEWTPVIENYGTSLGLMSFSDVLTLPGFAAPASGFFEFRLTAYDLAENTSVRVFSDILRVNPTASAERWEVYAVSRDDGIGLSAKATRLAPVCDAYSGQQLFVIHPTTNDIYFAYNQGGIYRIDAQTGLTTPFLRNGPVNLPTNGALDPTVHTVGSVTLGIDAAGRLYVRSCAGATPWNGTTIYQLDVVARTSRAYVGGGTLYDATATPSTAFVYPGPFAFDANNKLYFLTLCHPNVPPAPYPLMRLMSLTQNADGTPGVVAPVAGDCTSGVPGDGPTPAMNAPLTGTFFANLGSIAPVAPNAVYYALGNDPPRKIIDGNVYRTSIPAVLAGPVMLYDATQGRLLAADGDLRSYTVSLSGAFGEAATVVAAADGTGACTADGIDAAAACVSLANGMAVGPGGTVFFPDGPTSAAQRVYRIRYIDAQQKLQTVAGVLPSNTVGLHRRAITGSFFGLGYKPSTYPRQDVFARGLYIIDNSAVTLSRIDPVTERAELVWGNQQVVYSFPFAPEPIGPTLTMGFPYTGGGPRCLGFNADDGFPYLDVSQRFVGINQNKEVVPLLGGTNAYLEDHPPLAGAPSTTGPITTGFGGTCGVIRPSGTPSAPQAFFMVGSHYLGHTPDASWRAFDFSTMETSYVMGASGGSGSTADTNVPSEVTNAMLPSACLKSTGLCREPQYDANTDRLYYTECQGTPVTSCKIRYVEHPMGPGKSLGTVPLPGLLPSSALAPTPAQMRVSPNGEQVYFVDNQWLGTLFCHNISGAPRAECSNAGDAELKAAVGAPAGMAIGPGCPMVFDEGGRLYINCSVVYRYTPPP
jgi:hypothetical protein